MARFERARGAGPGCIEARPRRIRGPRAARGPGGCAAQRARRGALTRLQAGFRGVKDRRAGQAGQRPSGVPRRSPETRPQPGRVDVGAGQHHADAAALDPALQERGPRQPRPRPPRPGAHDTPPRPRPGAPWPPGPPPPRPRAAGPDGTSVPPPRPPTLRPPWAGSPPGGGVGRPGTTSTSRARRRCSRPRYGCPDSGPGPPRPRRPRSPLRRRG